MTENQAKTTKAKTRSFPSCFPSCSSLCLRAFVVIMIGLRVVKVDTGRECRYTGGCPDLSQAKLRPAVVLAAAGRGDWILCQITSNPYGDRRAIELPDASFAAGSLRTTSYAPPGKLFTANRDLMTTRVGALKAQAFQQVVEAVIALLRASVVV